MNFKNFANSKKKSGFMQMKTFFLTKTLKCDKLDAQITGLSRVISLLLCLWALKRNVI